MKRAFWFSAEDIECFQNQSVDLCRVYIKLFLFPCMTSFCLFFVLFSLVFRYISHSCDAPSVLLCFSEVTRDISLLHVCTGAGRLCIFIGPRSPCFLTLQAPQSYTCCGPAMIFQFRRRFARDVAEVYFNGLPVLKNHSCAWFAWQCYDSFNVNKPRFVTFVLCCYVTGTVIEFRDGFLHISRVEPKDEGQGCTPYKPSRDYRRHYTSTRMFYLDQILWTEFLVCALAIPQFSGLQVKWRRRYIDFMISIVSIPENGLVLSRLKVS